MKLTTTQIILLVVSLLLFIGIILVIVLDSSQRKVNDFDCGVDIIFIENGRERLTDQFRLWKQNWHSKYETRFIAIVTDDAEVHPIDNLTVINALRPDSTSQIAHEMQLFTNLHNYVKTSESDQSRYFLWASDNVFPARRNLRPSLFQSPNTKLLRFFNGMKADAVLLEAENDFEPTLPCTLFSYEKLQNHDFSDLKLDFLLQYQPTYIFSNELDETVILKKISDMSRLQQRLKSSRAFLVVHVSPISTQQPELNQKIKEFIHELLT